MDKEAFGRRLGLDAHVPTVLVMGGGQGLGPMKDAVKSMLFLERPLQIIVIAGTNVKLARWLKKVQRRTSKMVIFYDYADNVDELMEVSTLIISKPGGMTTSECLAKGLPMVIVDPIPGQEERNSRFLVSNGIAVRVDDKNRIGSAIDALLNDPAKIKAMRGAALAKGRPMAAEHIARFVLDL